MGKLSKLIVFTLFTLGIFSVALAEQKSISASKLINKYGFDSWNFAESPCKAISSQVARKLKSCVYQGLHKTAAGHHVQYRCQSKNKTEVLIYITEAICNKHYQAMYVEGF